MTKRVRGIDMNDVPSPSGSATAQRLRALAHLYQRGHVSDLMARTLDKLLAHEAEKCRIHLDQINADLEVFEDRYGFASDEFYRRFRNGQTDDRMDYVEWASLVQMRDSLRERFHLLTAEAEE